MKSSNDGTVRCGPATEENRRFRQLIEHEWDSIGPILYSRTRAALRKTRSRGELGGAIPGGHEVDDFIQKALKKGLRGLPEWDGERESLVECLWKIIKSRIKHYTSRYEAKRELRATTNPAEASAYVADVSNAEQACYEDPEDFAFEQEEVERILKRFAGRRDFKIVETILREDVSMPEEIAERLGMSVREVNNAKKRLKRDPYLLALKRKSDDRRPRRPRPKSQPAPSAS